MTIFYLFLVYTYGLSQEGRFITFYGTTAGPVGHAFVSFVREDNTLQQTVVDGVWGLYPTTRIGGAASFIVGEVPGEMRDDFLKRPDVGLTVKVNQKEYNIALKIKDRWSNYNYELTEKDCLSFVIAIANSLSPKIVLPQRNTFDFPTDYINSLKLLNPGHGLGSPSNNLIPSKLCNYQALLDNALNQNECDSLKIQYTKLLGIASKLGAYRRLYLQSGDLVNVFPTVYYHMTVIEMDKIRQGKVKYSKEKMEQMIYFFDAYEYNRKLSQEKREVHWKRHFTQVNEAGTYDFCQSFRKVMTSAIRAHVRFDLARAIRHSYDFGRSTSPVSALRVEFEATNNIFILAQTKALKDISRVTSCGSLGRFNLPIFGGISVNEIKSWRMAAFDKALSSRKPIQGYDGELIPQPSYFPHKNYYQDGQTACKESNPSCGNYSSTLFLFDLSGSMNENGGETIPKIQQAKNASKSTLNALRSNPQGAINQVAVYGFSGSCVTDPTREISSFDTDLNAVEQRINSMYAGGGTPLNQAIKAAECKMAAHLQKEGQQKGKLIILSDGQGTCGSIRPSGVYHSAPLQKSRSVIVNANQCGLSNGSPTSVSYYTVGFNIQPGSPAERDLQYLSQISGGKYLNVQNQTQLTRAFRKFNRTYQPKLSPALPGLSNPEKSNFFKGVTKIKTEYFDEALSIYETFAKQNPGDCNGVFNLALMQEANDFYTDAIDNYQSYLSLCPDASDFVTVEKQVSFLEEEFREFVQFQREVVQSDLNFLKLHFQKIQNGQSVALAEEFKGFLLEKGDYYEDLPRLIGNNKRFFRTITEEISSAFKQCKTLIRRNPNSWDRDAIPLISMSYNSMKELLEEM